MQKIKILVIFLLGGMLRSSAQGKNEDSVGIRPQTLQPTVVVGLRAGKNAPFAKTELSLRDIQKANLGQDLPYLLQYTPSAVVTSDAGTGVGYTGLRIRGTDGIRINVTMNGIPVNDAESQGAFFVDFPDIASSTTSIQVQRGVGTSTNGAGAFGATMSISNLYQFEKAGVELNNSVGSFNTWKNTLHAGTGILKSGFSFDLRLSRISSDGYIQRSSSDLKSMQLIAGWQASQRTSLRFMLMTGKEKTQQAWYGVPGDSLNTNRRFNALGLKSDGTYYNDQTDNYQQDYYQLFLDHKFSKTFSAHIAGFLTRGKGYYNEYQLGEAYSKYGLPDYISAKGDTITNTDLIRQLWLDNYYYGSVFSLLYEKKKTQITLGGAATNYEGYNYGYIKWAQYNVPADYRWYNLYAHKTDVNIYLKAQQTIGKDLILFGDAQYRNVFYAINGFRKNPSLHPAVNYDFFNPKVGLTYLIENTRSQKQKVYASFAVSNKEPNRDDFEASPVNLPKPERLKDYEAGYEFNNKMWTAGVNVYYMRYVDQLVLTGKINDVGAYTRTNVPRSYRAGVELQGGVSPVYWLRLTANATFSQNKVDNYIEYIDNYDDPSGVQKAITHSNTDIALSPAAIGAAVVTLAPFKNLSHHQNIEIDIATKYVGKQYLDNTSDINRSLKEYGLCDIRLRYTVRAKPFREIGATLALNNVFNKLYQSNGYVYYTWYEKGMQNIQNWYFPQAGFNWMLGVNMKW